jgi:hypothetical protein
MNRLFQLSFAVACFATQVMASGDEFTLECKHLKPSEAIRVLRSVSVFDVSIKEGDRRIIVTGGDPSLHKKMEELMELVDVPRISICPRFIKLGFADATYVAATISEAFSAGSEKKEVPLQSVPNTRTNEVFLMGTVQDIQAAEALVLLLDRAPTPVGRGCGELGF